MIPRHTRMGPGFQEPTARMTSFGATEPEGPLALSRDDNMIIDTTSLGEFVHPGLPNFAQGMHTTPTLWPGIGNSYPGFAVSPAAPPSCSVSPSVGLDTFHQSLSSDSLYGTGQAQEHLVSRPLGGRAVQPAGFDITANTTQEISNTQVQWTNESIQWPPLPQPGEPWVTNPVPEPISMPGCQSEPTDWSTNASLKSNSLRSISSSAPDPSDVRPSRLKVESPSSISGSSVPWKSVARRHLHKKVSRTQSQCGIRIRRDSAQSDLDDDFGYGSSSDNTRTGMSPKDKAFACPFYRMDPIQHMDCINLKLMRIRDVKQHINRKHTRVTFYCPRCLTVFASPAPWEKHILDQSCEKKAPLNPTSVLGVSEDMQRRLASRVDRKLSSSEQWYTIWKIIFGETTKALNPHLGTLVEETVGMMKDYWKQVGDDIIRDVLASRHMPAECAETSLLKDLFAEVQARFEQKTCQPGGVNAKSESNEDSKSQSMLPPPGSDSTKETQARSPLSSDWCWVASQSTSETEPAQLCSLQSQMSPISTNNNFVPPGWMPENAAHQQMVVESAASQVPMTY